MDNNNQTGYNYNHRPEENSSQLNAEAEIAALQQMLEEEKNRHLRTRADLENYRKRLERESEVKILNVKKEIILDLLEFLDYFEQARRQIRDPAAASGLDIMARQFYELLERHGVRPVHCLGQPFDPDEQEGVGYVKSDQYPVGCVVEEICAGYKLGDILLKPAQVMVAGKPEKEENEKRE